MYFLSNRLSVGVHPNYVSLGDFNADKKLDMVVSNQDSNTVSVLLGDGLGGFAAATAIAVTNRPFELVVGDFNGDGLPDLTAANPGEGVAGIMLQTCQ